MAEIHELFVLPLSLVWFAGATPESEKVKSQEIQKSKDWKVRVFPEIQQLPITSFEAKKMA